MTDHAHDACLPAAAVRLAPRLRRYALSLVGDAEAARDVVQDVLARVHDPSRPLAAVGRPAAYLFTAVRHRCLDHRRRESRMTTTPLEPARLPGREPDPAAAATTADAARAALLAVEALPPATREVVRLKFAGGLTYAEIAAATGKTTNNVGVLLHQGLKTLRRTLQAQGVDHA